MMALSETDTSSSEDMPELHRSDVAQGEQAAERNAAEGTDGALISLPAASAGAPAASAAGDASAVSVAAATEDAADTWADPLAGDAGVVIEMPKHKLIMLFIGLLVAMLTSSLDQTIVSTALPTIVGDLGGAEHMLWVVTAEVLAMTAVMPIFGKLGDMMGRKGLYLFSLVLLAVGSTICALSQNMGQLIVGRAVQGAGGGGLMILSQALIADVIPARVRSTYMGIMGVAYIMPALLGPLLGGFFTDVVSWHWAFWMNLPLAAISFIAGAALIPKNKPDATNMHFDVWGTVGLVGALVTLTLVTSLGGTLFAWNSPEAIGLIVGTVVFAVCFVIAEHYAEQPVVPLELFKNRNFVLTTLAGLLAMIALMGATSYLPTFYQISHGLTATESGFMELPAGITSTVSSILAGILIARNGKYKSLMVWSFVIATFGVGAFATVTPTTPVWLMCTYLGVAGFGLGLSMENLVLIAQNEFPVSMVGTVTAANNFFREVGTTLGASLVGALFTSNLSRTLVAELEPLGGMEALGISAGSITPAAVHQMPAAVASAVSQAYADAIAPVFLVVTPLIILGAVMMACLKNTPLHTKVE